MYKNQLQELAQRSCFNLPSYISIREGPDHAPRFKATVNFNGETYESPNYCTTLRQAEHSAAEVALNALASRGPSNSLAARILDETGVYKNLLQEVSQRVGASLPTYTTFRSGLGHMPIFTGTVELAGCTFTGEPAKNKKQAEKNAAMSAWLSLKLLTQETESSTLQKEIIEEQEHVTVARALQKFRLKARMSNIPFPIQFPPPNPKPNTAQTPLSTTSKMLPLICLKTTPRSRPHLTTLLDNDGTSSRKPESSIPSKLPSQNQFKITNTTESHDKPTTTRPHKFPAVGAAPYIPVGHFRAHHGMAPPVTIRNAIPVFAAPPLPIPHMGIAQPNQLPPQFRAMPPTMCGLAPPVTIRQAVPVYSAPTPNFPKPHIKPSASPKPPMEEKGHPTSTAQDSKSHIKAEAVSSSAVGVLSIPKEEEGKF
uniref:double-stranded RNA-binding protein 2-like n=1 Tax=Erigeron canadensis TaxID=72917 RepID=UPI001CB9A4FE|nr:double-stranded RNA-binding protein 2-like [Erigeron canadensis]